MNIFGKKVVLRALEARDNDMLLELINDPETERMLGGAAFPVSFDNQAKWLSAQDNKGNILRCAVAPREDELAAVGTVILSDIDYRNGTAQVHIKMSKERGRGKGYGTDAIQAIVGYAFKELRLNCVYADVLEYNLPSQGLFEKCGFKRDGVLRHRVYKDGDYRNIISYSILKSDYEAY